jgi:hypothetical protein
VDITLCYARRFVRCKHRPKDAGTKAIKSLATFDLFRFFTMCCVCVHAKIRSKMTEGALMNLPTIPSHLRLF